MRSIDWTARARDDLAGIDAYWWAIDRELADKLLTRIEAAANILLERPQIGRLVDDRVRKWGVHGTPYLLLYRDSPNRVEVLRVHHGSQDWTGAA